MPFYLLHLDISGLSFQYTFSFECIRLSIDVKPSFSTECAHHIIQADMTIALHAGNHLLSCYRSHLRQAVVYRMPSFDSLN